MHVANPPAELAPGFWMLGTAAYPFYFDTAGQTLFEGGTGLGGPLLLEQLAALGGSLRQIVLTHAHPDHVMSLPALRRQFPQVAVLGSAAAAAALANEKALEFFAKMDDALAAKLAPGQGNPRPPFTAADFVVDRALAEGDQVESGGASFAVFQTPGHSDCSLSFFDAARKLLVLSDATGYYLPAGRWWWPNYFTDYRQYVGSIERLAGLGAEVLCLSHNAAIVGRAAVKDYFDACLQTTRDYHAGIVAAAAAGRSPREIGETLGAEVFARTQVFALDFFQKNCGLLAKLSLKAENA